MHWWCIWAMSIEYSLHHAKLSKEGCDIWVTDVVIGIDAYNYLLASLSRH